jgi:LCP family protein required for cell wall assembly
MFNNSSTQKSAVPERKTQSVFRLKAVLAAVLSLSILALLTVSSIRFSEKIGIGNYFVLAKDFLLAPIDKVQSGSGRVNLLVMGRAGGEHAGPDLTDTMIVASISLDRPSIATISIPRDLWIPAIRAKINSAFYWGGQLTPGGGLSMAKSTVGEVLGIPVHYGILIDFSGFENLINVIGGIQVNVERSFTDNQYPIAGRENDLCGGDKEYKCRYETVAFREGLQTMDGATALKFVRSRHAEGEEGTDIAREARQQKVIDGIKNQLLNPKTFLNPWKDVAIFQAMKNSIETDLNGPSVAVVARRAFDSSGNISHYTIPEDLLKNPPISSAYDKQYVFIPKAGNGNWSEIRSWISSILN